jgi:hypothetical protein
LSSSSHNRLAPHVCPSLSRLVGIFHLFLLSLLISLTNSGSHLYLAAPYRRIGHLQHHKVSWHLSRF